VKQFPLDVTAVITVSDNGSSTGALKEELDIPRIYGQVRMFGPGFCPQARSPQNQFPSNGAEAFRI